MWANYYGRDHLGEITGISRTCEMVGMALGPLLLGASREYYGEYRTGCWVMAVAAACLSVSMLFLNKPTPLNQQGADGGGAGGAGGDAYPYQSRELNHPCRMESNG